MARSGRPATEEFRTSWLRSVLRLVCETGSLSLIVIVLGDHFARASAFVSLILVSWRCSVDGAEVRSPSKKSFCCGVAMRHGICDNRLRNVINSLPW